MSVFFVVLKIKEIKTLMNNVMIVTNVHCFKNRSILFLYILFNDLKNICRKLKMLVH